MITNVVVSSWRVEGDGPHDFAPVLSGVIHGSYGPTYGLLWKDWLTDGRVDHDRQPDAIRQQTRSTRWRRPRYCGPTVQQVHRHFPNDVCDDQVFAHDQYPESSHAEGMAKNGLFALLSVTHFT
jgi:hypothetical protein